ncbi:MAG: alanine racemase [Anaerolineaceae bacterium]|nr:MAG: alanine racemase [Anaerolineaceae bacterium]
MDDISEMINLYEFVTATNGQILGEPAAQLFDAFSADAAQIKQGQMFVAIATPEGDIQANIRQAIQNGARGLICKNPPQCDTDGVSVVMVRDVVGALMQWAQYMLGRYGTQVIGVAGVAGKSITADAIGRVLSTRYAVHSKPDAADGRLSVPFALASLKPSDQFTVLKLSMSEVGEMGALAEAAQPQTAVITNISNYHMGGFASPDQMAEEMRVLVDLLPPGGVAVINHDDDRVRGLATTTRADVSTYGTSFGADMMAYNIQAGDDGTVFDLRMGNERHNGIKVSFLSKHHINCLLAALQVGLHHDIPLADGLRALGELSPLPGRLRPLDGRGGSRLIDGTYGGGVLSAMGMLDWLEETRKTAERRVFFMLGDIDNPGKNHAAVYRAIGQRAAKVVDVLFTQGTGAAIAGRAALDYGLPPDRVQMTATPQDAIKRFERGYQLDADDLVVINAGIACGMQQFTRSLLEREADIAQLPAPPADSILSHPTRLTWLEINYDAIANNVRQLKAMLSADVALMAVVKADAYGHGAEMTARTALDNGAEWLGVSSVHEALALREAGINAPILAMNYTPPYMARHAMLNDITLTVFDIETASAYDRVAAEINNKVTVHIKLDSGMGRIGVLPDGVVLLVRHLSSLQNVQAEGIFTHFSMADSLSDYTEQQTERFMAALRDIQSATGRTFKYVHAANSAATVAHPAAHFDLVRPGIALYGLHPSDDVTLPEGFQPALTWKTLIAQIKTLPAGHPIGYGNTYITEKPERVALLPVGYGDGYRRGPQNAGEVLVRGQRAPIRGRVSMEKTIISIEHIPQAAVGDEVVLIGKQGSAQITAEQVAANIGTINYEITCNALPRLPRR